MIMNPGGFVCANVVVKVVAPKKIAATEIGMVKVRFMASLS